VEHQLWLAIVEILTTLDLKVKPTAFDFSDRDIVQIYYWAIIHDRPTSWACQRRNWPSARRRRRLPVPSTMSRRLRSAPVKALLDALERRVVAPKEPGLFWRIDGKPLVIGGCSKDRQAGYGRAAKSKAKGYKIHAILGADASIACWRLAPMNKDERTMAARMLRTAPIQGYVVADGNYDANPIHDVCDARGDLQLVTPRRQGPNQQGPAKGTGHRKQAAGRLRSIALTSSPFPQFAEGLLHDRADIGRRFGNWTNWGGGLTCLPAWVRTYRRVHRWVQAKLVLTGLKHL
jgi:hypothetical protein